MTTMKFTTGDHIRVKRKGSLFYGDEGQVIGLLYVPIMGRIHPNATRSRPHRMIYEVRLLHNWGNFYEPIIERFRSSDLERVT